MATLLEKTWWVAVLRGVLAMLFGLFLILYPQATLKIVLTLFAIFLLIDGIIAIIGSLANTVYNDWWVGLIVGVLEVAIGVGTLMRPEITATILIILIGLWALLRGLVDLLSGIALKEEIEGEWILIIGGLLQIVFGVLAVLFPFLETGEALIWFVGIYALMIGVLWVILGVTAKGWAKELREMEAEVEA